MTPKFGTGVDLEEVYPLAGLVALAQEEHCFLKVTFHWAEFSAQSDIFF